MGLSYNVFQVVEMRRSNAAVVNKTGGPTSSTTVGDSQSQGTSFQDAMDVEVVQATPNISGEATRESERRQLVLPCDSSESGDSQPDEGTGGSGDGEDGGSAGGNGGSPRVPVGGGSQPCGGNGTATSNVAEVPSSEGTGEGVVESSGPPLEMQSDAAGRGLESLPHLERARRQFIGLTKAGNNVHAGLIHGDLHELIEKMRKKPYSKAVLKIPLCRMIHMPMVRPTLRCDVVKLMGAFRYGYKPNSAAMYVSITNDQGEDRFVSQEDIDQWNPCWVLENEAFEERLKSDPDLQCLSGSMFYVYDGNHRLLAWKEVIETLHANDQQWYTKNGNPECIVLDTAGGRGDILSAMHNINS
jgi:hypothetical protein